MRLAALATALALASPAALAEEPPAESAPSTDVSPGAAADAPADARGTRAGAAARKPEEALPRSSPAAAPAPGPGAQARRPSQWGVLLDAGFPQGVALSATFRPVSSVRFFAGPAWNYVGFGIQGGVSVVPWHFAVTPILTAEAGRYFGEDVSFIARSGSGVPPDLRPLMKDMTYTYGALHAGIELGSQSGFTWSIEAGLAFVSLRTQGTVTTTDTSGTTVTFRDPRVRATLPSLRLGLHYWF